MRMNYLTETFQADTLDELRIAINKYLKDDKQIEAINISISVTIEEGFVAILLYKYEQ